MNYKLIAISKLLSFGYNTFIPTIKPSLDYNYIIEQAGVISTIVIIPVHYINQVPICKLTKGKPPRYRDNYILQYIICVEEITKKVWMIPFEDVVDITSISLKKRYDDYLLVDNSHNNEEVFSLSDKGSKFLTRYGRSRTTIKSVFTQSASDLGNKLKDGKIEVKSEDS